MRSCVATHTECNSEQRWMREALAQARAAQDGGEVPIGAVVVRDGEIIGRGQNSVITAHDPTAHAEILALREAAKHVGNYRLSECEMYATLEPCAMCAGALVHARVAKLVYASTDPKAGAAGSVLNVINHEALNHRIEVVSGILAEESSELLQNFFRAWRKKS